MPPLSLAVTNSLVPSRPAAIWIALWLVVCATGPAFAIDPIPTTTGFGGFVLAAPGVFSVKSNLVVEGQKECNPSQWFL